MCIYLEGKIGKTQWIIGRWVVRKGETVWFRFRSSAKSQSQA